MKLKIGIGIMLLVNLVVFSQTELSAGDIAILQYNSDGIETIKFLALRSMENGTTINFTDNGWKNDNTFRSNEGIDIWTASGNITCGDIITFTFTNIALNGNGDQILAYQGLSVDPTFIFAINSSGSGVWQTTANNAKTSAVPLGLIDGDNAIALNHIDNAMYDGSTLIDSKSVILGEICNLSNWGGSNTVNQDFSDTFTSETIWSTSWTGTPTSDYFKAIVNGDYDTATDGDFNACELEITVGNTLTVNTSGIVIVENGITNSGAIVVEDDGTLVQETKDGSNTGTVYRVERQTSILAEQGDYTYWSSPLTSSTFGDAVTAQLYYSFDANTQSWSAGSSASSISAGVGFIATGAMLGTYPLQYTASFTGSAFNNGDISVTLGYSSDADNTNDANLLGNPYPSALDADAFLTANTNLGGTLYFWTHNTEDSAGNNTQDDYVYWNGMGGLGSCTGCTAPDGNIASGQGFFAQSIAAGDVTFTNQMRVTTSGDNDLFYKTTAKSEEKENDRIWLNITSDAKFSQMLFGYHEKATEGVDRLYDAERSIGGQGLFINSLFEDKSFAIQGKENFTGYEELSLNIASDLTGEHKIEIDHLEGIFKNIPVIIRDNTLDLEHDLSTGAYIFNLDIAGEYNDRFVLKIGEYIVENPEDSQVKVYVKKNTLKIKSPTKLSGIRVFDIHGKKLYSTNKSKKNYSIKMKKISNAKVLIVHIELENGEVSKKKVLIEN